MKIIILIFLQLALIRSLPYQAHGFNDLPYMLQLVKKGVTYFKMDVSPATKDSCLLQSEWKETDNDCQLFKSGFMICCLAFRGDTGSIPIYKQPFNITSEFIQVIRSNEQYFGKNVQGFYGQKKVFAFNFQYDDEFADLSKHFLLDLIEIMEDFNIEILTGSDRFVEAYENKCSVKCDSSEQRIAQSNIYFQTSQIERNKEREQNYNTFYNNIDYLCEMGWPDWIGKFDAIFWEPSHEYQVQKIREKFYDPQCKIPDHLRDIDLLRIASNLEPETLQIFWKKPVNGDIYDPEDQKRLQYGNFKDPKIEYDAFNDNFILAYEVDEGIQLQQLTINHNIISEKWVGNKKVKSLKVSDTILLLQTESHGLLYNIEEQQLSLLKQIPINQNQLISITSKNYIILTAAKNSIQLDFYDLKTDELQGSNLIDNQMINFLNLSSLNFDSILFNNNFYLAISFTPNSDFESVNLILTIYDENFQVIKTSDYWNFVDFGKSNEIKLYEFNNEIYLTEIHQNGICQSAILLNNNEQNKCGHIDYTKYQGLNNVKFMLNYFYGKFTDIFDRVDKGTIINGCDLNIMHAKLGNGNNPSFTIRNNQMYVVSEFISFSELPQITMLFCGSSNDYKSNETQGLIYFSFDILDPKLF